MTQITEDDVLRDLYAICEANPERVNPTTNGLPSGQCLYDAEGVHCLAAEFLAGRNLPMPKEGTPVAWIMDPGSDWVGPPFTLLALDVLTSAQSYADEVHEDPAGDYLTTWGEVASLLHAEYGVPG